MKKIWILFLVGLIFLSTGLIQPEMASAIQYPESVRIGLYYGTKSVAGVSVRSESGLSIGFVKNSVFTIMIDEMAEKTYNLRKDAWFVQSTAGIITEFNPNIGIPTGVVSGPNHIRIGDAAPDYATAVSIASNARKTGIKAFPVYEGGWYVWTGFYASAQAAQDGIKTVADALGSISLSVVPSTNDRIVVFDENFEVVLIYSGVDGPMRVLPKTGGTRELLYINGKRYRGAMELKRYADSDMTVINDLNIEQYLYGVVPAEIEASGPYEAVKAQAVAARTYAYKNMNRYPKWGFDMVNTNVSQVYGGYDAEHPQSNRAVDETKGMKALYNGELASLFYFSSSGGMTEDNIYVWGTPFPYLTSVPDPYESKMSYNYYWQKTLTAADVKAILASSGIDLGDILGVNILETSPAGRVTKLQITGSLKSITYYKEACRILFGLPSQMYTIGGSGTMSVMGATGEKTSVQLDGLRVMTATGATTVSASGSVINVLGSNDVKAVAGTASNLFVFTGKGWGHGIGMSQEGAKGFALQGYTYEQILKHYFTGITIQ